VFFQNPYSFLNVRLWQVVRLFVIQAMCNNKPSARFEIPDEANLKALELSKSSCLGPRFFSKLSEFLSV